LRKFGKIVLLVVLVLLFISGDASARFISEEEARLVVQNWLEITAMESLSMEGTEIREVMHFVGELHGNPGFYAVLLEPCGWVIVPAHDSFEAIIAFGQGSFTREEFVSSPLAAFLRVDVVEEESFLRGVRNAVPQQKTTRNDARSRRWQALSNLPTAGNNIRGRTSSGPRHEIEVYVVVNPILKDNMWGQRYLHGAGYRINYFNLHTEWKGRRFPVGCTAVATAQLMSVFGHPLEAPRVDNRFYNPIFVEKIFNGIRISGNSPILYNPPFNNDKNLESVAYYIEMHHNVLKNIWREYQW